jgi:hypothetical protein
MEDPDVRVEHVGAGEPINGHPTDHWRVVSRYAMVMSGTGADIRMLTEAAGEYWYGEPSAASSTAASLPAAPNALSAMFAPELQKRLAAAVAALPEGQVVRTATSMVMSREGQEIGRSTTRTDVLDVTRGPIDLAAFVVPAGYKSVPFPPEP